MRMKSILIAVTLAVTTVLAPTAAATAGMTGPERLPADTTERSPDTAIEAASGDH